MNILSLEEFEKFYIKKGYLPFGMYTPKKLNDKQLKNKYDTYVKRVTKKFVTKVPSYWYEWTQIREQVLVRDNNECRLWKVLSEYEFNLAKSKGFDNKYYQRTPAHFIPRSRDKSLVCEIDNVYTIAIYFHTRLDIYCDPITGTYIGKEKTLDYWKRIIDNDIIFNTYKEKF